MQLSDGPVGAFGVVLDEIIDACNAAAPLADRRPISVDDLPPPPTIEELSGD
jgi:hypothetical protein